MIRLADCGPTELPYAHLSTLWNASLGDFKDAVRQMQEHAHVITLTEMGADSRIEWLRNWELKGWGWGCAAYYAQTKGECAILWRRDIFPTVKARAVHPLTDLQVRTGDGTLRAPVALNKVILGHRSGRNVVVSALHQVSGIEDQVRNYLKNRPALSRRLETPPDADHRLEVALDVFRGLKKRNAIIRRYHPKAAKLQALDSNLNLEYDLLRGFLEDITGMNFPQRSYARISGTHGNRTIDGVLLEDCSPVGAVLEFQAPGMDHDGINGVVQL